MLQGRTRITTFQNTVIIYNPQAGKLRRNGGHLIEKALASLRAAGHVVTAEPTTAPNTAAALARQCIERGVDLVLAAGGDGTINEVANGMIGSHVPLGILPAGTANVLAMEMGMGSRMTSAIAGLTTAVPRRIAVGLLHTATAPPRYFLLMTGIGLDAHIVYNLNMNLKARFGKVAYWVQGLAQLGRRLTTFDVRVPKQQQIHASFALVSRVANYGGDLSIARSAHLLRPDFDVVVFEGSNSLIYSKYLIGVFAGRLQGMKGITMSRATEIELNGATDSSIYIQADGEYAGKLPARIEIVQDALTLMMPTRYCASQNGNHG